MSWRGKKGRGNGRWRWLEPLPVYRGTTNQVCGLWPFGVGTGLPQYGAILGKHQETSVAVPCDPITYFTTGLISNPSMFLMGKPGLGKSTLASRMIIALENMGIHTLVLGDLKPDYVEVITALGGQIITLGRNVGHLNVLDHQYAVEAAERSEWRDGQVHYLLPEDLRQRLYGQAHGRRKVGVESLINTLRGTPPTERESSILDAAMSILFRTWNGPGCPLLRDLTDVIEEASDELRLIALDHGNMATYHSLTDSLVSTLRSLGSGDGLGSIFAQRTTISMRTDCSVNFDISAIGENETKLQAGALLACWNFGFGQVEVQQLLADYKIIPRQNYLVVLDELWRALRVGKGMVDRVDESTRLNRAQGIGILYITHTLADLSSVADDADRAKAEGIAERCGIIGLFGLPQAEMARLKGVVPLSEAEQAKIIGWSAPAAWVQRRGKKAKPAGLGLCMLKVSGRTGIPLIVELTEEEEGLHDTNQRWAAMASA
jgi:hypothetical protein